MPSLSEKQGQLGLQLAAHLLRRTTYNVTPGRIDYFSSLTADQAVNELFDPSGSPPAYPNGPLENGNPIFSSTNGFHQPGASNSGGVNIKAIDMWRIYESIAATNATWKIANWVGSIFTIAENGTRFSFHYWKMLSNMAFTNLIDLAFHITFDNFMLQYLNNKDNIESEPNENYSREFLELFTIGKGDAIAIGNYTNYTEADISAAARIFTGIKQNDSLVSPTSGVIRGQINILQHDTDPKSFSTGLGGLTINGGTTEATAEAEIMQFIQMVFNQDATAQRYVRKMYRYFVNDKISADVEADIIIPLAVELKASGYDHVATLRKLFKSEHFFDEDDAIQGDNNIGAKIKSPFELLKTTYNLLEAQDNSTAAQKFDSNYSGVAKSHLIDVGMDIRGPVTVEGYSGYNDGPGYSKNWYSANFLYNRHTFGLSYRRGKVRNTEFPFAFQTNILTWVENNVNNVTGTPGTSPFDPKGAADANKLVNDMLKYLLVKIPVGDRLIYFQDQLLNGLSPINWYFTWKDYHENGTTENVTIGITRLYDAILSSPEFQIF